MIQLPDYPPNIKDIAKVIKDVMSYSNAVFTYGNVIYNPGGHHIDECVGLHEATHSLQQEKIGGEKKWWKRWLSEPTFRIAQEVEGYGNQYRRFCELNKSREKRFMYLYNLARDLSSKQYGSVISLTEARKQIQVYFT